MEQENNPDEYRGIKDALSEVVTALVKATNKVCEENKSILTRETIAAVNTAAEKVANENMDFSITQEYKILSSILSNMQAWNNQLCFIHIMIKRQKSASLILAKIKSGSKIYNFLFIIFDKSTLIFFKNP